MDEIVNNLSVFLLLKKETKRLCMDCTKRYLKIYAGYAASVKLRRQMEELWMDFQKAHFQKC